jgi:hypothetical protein
VLGIVLPGGRQRPPPNARAPFRLGRSTSRLEAWEKRRSNQVRIDARMPNTLQERAWSESAAF